MNGDLDRLLREAVASLSEAARLVNVQTESKDKQTATFVRQIEKLSSRLDEAHIQTVELTKLVTKQQASYDRLFMLLEKEIQQKQSIINNSCN